MTDTQKARDLINEAALQREIREAATDHDTRIIAGIMAELAEEELSRLALQSRSQHDH